MSTKIDLNNLLGTIPSSLKSELIIVYNEIVRNFRESRWEPSELNGGKLCEVVYSILNGVITGSYPSTSSKPRNMVDACKALEQAGSTFPRSVRIQIPRMIVALYEIRNNRGVGHVGGDVNPNMMDAYAVLRMSKWILAELIRVLHNVDVQIAEEAVESLTDKTLQIVWEINGKKRILDPNLSMKDKTLLLLYHSNHSISETELVQWIEHSNASVFRRDVLKKAHKDRLIEYDQAQKLIDISPVGIRYVEEKLTLDI
ncbi:MAG: hypothetical protein WDZ80_03610 [Candidatus Paceibacterota bacterium]